MTCNIHFLLLVNLSGPCLDLCTTGDMTHKILQMQKPHLFCVSTEYIQQVVFTGKEKPLHTSEHSQDLTQTLKPQLKVHQEQSLCLTTVFFMKIYMQINNKN